MLDPSGTTSITAKEIFGPVVTVEQWTDEDEAVDRANATEYGLAAGVWTTSMSRALSISSRFEAGKVWVNEHHRDATEMPHGGVKRSDYGSDLCAIAVHEYTTAKAGTCSIRVGHGWQSDGWCWALRLERGGMLGA